MTDETSVTVEPDAVEGVGAAPTATAGDSCAVVTADFYFGPTRCWQPAVRRVECDGEWWPVCAEHVAAVS